MGSGAPIQRIKCRQRPDEGFELYCASCSTVIACADSLECLYYAGRYRCKCLTGRAESDRLLFHRFLYTAADDEALQRISPWRQAGLLALALGLLYVLPTVLESSLMATWDPWLTIIGLGDALGCLCIALVFRRPRLALELYLATALAKICLYHFHIIPLSLLLLLADFVPTVVVLAFIWICPSRVQAEVARRG